MQDAYILTANISLEYEKAEVNAGFFYSSAEQREALVAAERAYTDERCRKVIELKKKVGGQVWGATVQGCTSGQRPSTAFELSAVSALPELGCDWNFCLGSRQVSACLPAMPTATSPAMR
jgi:hypothetical protein